MLAILFGIEKNGGMAIGKPERQRRRKLSRAGSHSSRTSVSSTGSSPQSQNSPHHIPELTDAIDVWVSHWNNDPKPFVWTKTAKEIITKVKRGHAALTHQIKSETDH